MSLLLEQNSTYEGDATYLDVDWVKVSNSSTQFTRKTGIHQSRPTEMRPGFLLFVELDIF